MPGWPSPGRMDDRRLAESLAAGDVDALPQIFDGHAARLYDYCHALLRDQESAAAALYDSFLAACEHVGRLREPERFRSWLYALVRNESLRRLHDPGRPAEHGFVSDPRTGEARPRQEAPEVEDAFLDNEGRIRRQETRQLVHSALSGLSGRQREALDLLLRHDLDAPEIAGVLGLGRRETAQLTEEARGTLDEALAASVIARTGRGECPEVAALVDGWDWPLTPVVCRKVIRHIESCEICTERRHRKVSTARLLQVLPVALMPAELRARVLAGATLPEHAAERTAAAQRAEPFDEPGWPIPVEQPGHRAAGRGHRRSRGEPPKHWPAIAAAVMVIVVVSAAFMWLPGSGKPTSSGTSPKAAASDPEDSAIGPPTESDEPSKSTEPTPSTSTSTPSHSSSPAPTDKTERSPKPTTTPTRVRPTVSGSLAVSGCSIPSGDSSCSITLTANGGTVRWSVRSANGVSASGSGTLESGWSVAVTASRIAACQGRGGAGTVTFAPSGTAGVRWTCPPSASPTPPKD